MENKIIKLYNKANIEQINYGLTWYNRAHNECLLLSQVFEIPLEKVIGIVSALSVNNKWQNNLKDTWNFLESPSLTTKISTYKIQRNKALEIYNLKSANTSTILQILKGEKTTKFYKNILNYKTSQEVTVDVWAFRSVEMKQSKKNYKLVEQAYTNVSKQLGILPHQCQAIVWGVIRGKIT